MLFTGLAAALGGGGAAAGTAGAAAAGTAATAGATAAAAGGGLSLASILQGTATVLGIVSSIGAGNAEADALNAQAIDTQREESQETLQGIERRTSIKRALVDSLGAQDVAYAGSGVDLSFGTAGQARKEAFREADLATTSASGTEQTRVLRLGERAAQYRRGAKQAKRMGVLDALTGGLKGGISIAERGGW